MRAGFRPRLPFSRLEIPTRDSSSPSRGHRNVWRHCGHQNWGWGLLASHGERSGRCRTSYGTRYGPPMSTVLRLRNPALGPSSLGGHPQAHHTGRDGIGVGPSAEPIRAWNRRCSEGPCLQHLLTEVGGQRPILLPWALQAWLWAASLTEACSSRLMTVRGQGALSPRSAWQQRG